VLEDIDPNPKNIFDRDSISLSMIRLGSLDKSQQIMAFLFIGCLIRGNIIDPYILE
jgi:hypothetical protein